MTSGTRYYTVRSGDNLSKISIAVYQDASKWRLLADQNNIRDPRKLKPGTILRY
jgi:nucleoid-associated protein YgaU